METLFSALQSAFNLSARNGWIMLAFGGSMVGLSAAELIPLKQADSSLMLLFVALTVLGIVVLAVHFFAWIVGNLRQSAAEDNERAHLAAKFDRFLDEGVRNLDVLDDMEIRSLVWILRQGSQRFRGDSIGGAWGPGGLLNKKVIHRDPGTSANDVWMVNQRVWDTRDSILKKHSSVYTTEYAPW